MLRRASLTALLSLIIPLIIGTSLPAFAQELSPAGVAQIQALIADKMSRTPDERKIDSNLLFAARAALNARFGIQAPLPVYVKTFLDEEVDADGDVMINIRATVSETLIDEIASMGASEIRSFAQYDTITARLPIVNVYQVAALADVRFVAPLEKAFTNSSSAVDAGSGGKGNGSAPTPKAGSVTSQGVVAHAADLAIASGVDGTGLMTCVISDGIDSYAARQATGDLPTPISVLAGQLGAGNEGTAMLEIVHDIAPGAALGFSADGASEAQMATNIVNLRSSMGCAVIVDDITWNRESAFQDGPIAQAVNSVTAAGALYLSSAANSGNVTHGTSGTWEGDWLDSGWTWNDYPAQRFGLHQYDVLSSAGLYLSLKWSDPRGASSNDYDLYLVNSAGTAIIQQSTNWQTGSQDPFEGFSCSAADACPAGSLVVVVKFAGSPRALRVDTHRGRLSVSTAGSTYGHHAASTALTVAAVNVATAGGSRFVGGATNPVEPFSADGPRTVFYYPNGMPITPGNVLFDTGGGTTLAKVDLAAADGVVTASPGFNPFFGTSAAAPHAAGLAALVWSAHPSASAATVRSALLASALDIEAAGFDRDSGVGIVMAPAAVRAVMTPMTVGIAFAPVQIASDGTSTLTIALTNPNAVTLHNVAFTDTYPPQIHNAATPNPGRSGAGCDGILLASPSGGSFAMTGGTVPAGGTCNFFVTVTGSIGGVFLDSTGTISTPVGLNSAAATATLTVTKAPTITSGNSTTFTVGAAGTFTVTATGYPAPALAESGLLPAGVTFTPGPGTGALAGVPGTGTGGIHFLTLNATNGVPPNASQGFTLTVNEAPLITSPNSATCAVGLPCGITVTASGFPAPTFSLAGALPPGMNFDTGTGVLSGMPGSPGTFALTLGASNGVAPSASQAFTLTVSPSSATTMQRTWVASYGNDANACYLAAPCRSFNRAISQTSANGEVVVLDSAGYGPATIAQPVTIVSPRGVHAGVSVSSGTGIVVNAGSGARVVLRGLTIESQSGAIGIDFQSGAALYVERTSITGFTTAGLNASPNAAAAIYLRDVKIRDNATGAVFGPTPASAGLLSAEIDRTEFETNSTGLSFEGRNTTAVIRSTVVSGGLAGVVVQPSVSGGQSAIELRHSTMSKNSVVALQVGSGAAGAGASAALVGTQIVGNGIGVLAQTAGSVFTADCTISENATGLSLAGGTVVSVGDNRVFGNTSNGAFSSTIGKQ